MRSGSHDPPRRAKRSPPPQHYYGRSLLGIVRMMNQRLLALEQAQACPTPPALTRCDLVAALDRGTGGIWGAIAAFVVVTAAITTLCDLILYSLLSRI